MITRIRVADDIGSKTPYVLGWVGRILGPLAALLVYFLMPSGTEALSEAARATAAIGVLMAILWMTEAMPLPATSLLPLALFPLAGVPTFSEAAAPYAHEFIFLFLGGFLVALAMERWNLHRRVALLTVLAVGTNPRRLIGGFMLATGFLSMWISNTAAAVMMLPIGVSVSGLVREKLKNAPPDEANGKGRRRQLASATNFGICLMLGIAYGANIGGLGTLIGSPPNLFLASFLRGNYDIHIGFAQWMMMGIPLVAVTLTAAWLLLTYVVFPIRVEEIPGGTALFRSEMDKLGKVTRGEWTVLFVFLLAATLWIVREPLTNWEWLTTLVPPVANLSDSAIAIIAALLLFAIPVDAKRSVFALDWQQTTRLPWGILLLFGGGLSLAAAIRATGLDLWIGQGFGGLGGMPLIALIFITTAVVILLTNVTSNTATAATFLPILGGIALSLGLDPALLALPAALAASCALMLPVGTPPNAIVFGSGHIKIGHMIKGGALLTLVCMIIIPLVVYFLAPWALGISLDDMPARAAAAAAAAAGS
jgi:solute carrier family 13 (sodium-dependent dicarboxylate transporter), member 2/3/5